MAFRLPLDAKRPPDYLQVPMPLGVQEPPGITRAESTDKKHGYLWCLEWHLNRQPPHLTLGRRRGRPGLRPRSECLLIVASRWIHEMGFVNAHEQRRAQF